MVSWKHRVFKAGKAGIPMNGINHMIANVETAAVVGCLWHKSSEALRAAGVNGVAAGMARISNWVASSVFPSMESWGRMAAGGAVALVLFLFGSLAPDMDSKESLLGRYVHVPVRHRRILHTAWWPLALLPLAWRVPVVLWLCLGFLGHLFWDGLSVAGICPFYPIQKYVEYPSGAYVAKGHRLKLYHTGGIGEYVLVGVMTVATVGCLAWTFLPWGGA